MTKMFDAPVWKIIIRTHIKNILFGALSLALGTAALIGFNYIDDGALRVLLWPHSKITGAFYNINLPYQNGVGYVSPERGFIIGPDCIGIRFIAMLFCMAVCVFTRRFRGAKKISFFILSFIGSAAVGILANCMRIIGSVPIVSSDRFTTIHAGSGVVIYLLTLVITYMFIDRFTRSPYEKLNSD